MLVHADAGDFVVAPFERHVIGQRYRDPVAQPQTLDSGLRMIVLRLGQGDAVGKDAVALRRMAQERAPAAADVEEGLAGAQPQLAADEVELVPLRLLERVGPVAEIRAGIDHLRIEEELIEFVAGIVMKLDELLFLVLRPPGRIAAMELVTDRGRPIVGEQQGQRLGPGKTLAQIPEANLALLLAPARGIDEIEQIAALDVDVADRVAPEQVLERRPPEQRAEHPRSGDPDARAVRAGAPERDLGAVPEPERERRVEDPGEVLEDLARGLDLSFLQPAFPEGGSSREVLCPARTQEAIPVRPARDRPCLR